MSEQPVFVVVEIMSVTDREGFQAYAQQAGGLIGAYGGTVVAQGGHPVADGEEGFAPLVIQRWTSEAAFRDWIASDAYRPLNAIRLASATMRAAIVPAVGRPQQS